MFTTKEGATGKVYNVAFGERCTVNQLFEILKNLSSAEIDPIYREPRTGDVRHSLADIGNARKLLGDAPQFDIDRGLEITFKWFQKAFD